MRPLSRPRRCLTILALSTALLGAGAAVPAAASSAGLAPAVSSLAGRPYVETSLFFGTARPDGGPDVTDAEFRAFVDAFVTPRFPAGLTVQEARGQYRDAHGTIERERSYELILFYPAREARLADPKIEEIRAEYEARFGQESVARVDRRVTVDF
ncbi:DUF3574 domain-containing protein [Streptomyces sp. KL116D]|uniref:DUF3574 domain-containing protein n=1 Tax=Streptomyces sp. KL116D TaxID=3045152 RepID=UPI0035592F68